MCSQVDVHHKKLSKYADCSLSVRAVLFNDAQKMTDSRAQLWLLLMDTRELSIRKSTSGIPTCKGDFDYINHE